MTCLGGTFDTRFSISKLVDSSALAEEHNLQLLPVRVVIQEFGHSFIYRIILYRNIDGHFSLEVDRVDFERFDLRLLIPNLLQKLQAFLVCLVDFLLEHLLVI